MEDASRSSAGDLAQTISEGLSLHGAGNLRLAEARYREVLAVDPDHVDALHFLGVLLHQTGRPEEARNFIGQALGVHPEFAIAHNHLGDVLQSLGLHAQAEASYRRAVELEPALALAWNNLANALLAQGRIEEAADSFQRAIELQPGLVEGHFNLGVVRQAQARPDEAIVHYRQALSLDPRFVQAHYNLAVALHSKNELEPAAEGYRSVLALAPGHAEACNNLGNALVGLARYQEALASYDRALRIMPDSPDFHCNRGNALRHLDRPDEALADFDAALARSPDHANSLYNRGVVLKELGRLAEAQASLRRAVLADPNRIEARSHWVFVCQLLCLWPGLAEEAETLRQLARGDTTGKVPPSNLLSLPNFTAAEQRECASRTAAAGLSAFLALPPIYDGAKRSPGRKIRVGYLSADFRDHPVSALLAEVVERHDRDRFEIFGYSLGREDASALRVRLKAAFGTFVDFNALPDEDAARRVFDDRIDILVDLMGYTAGTRLQILARRPAPVQVNWLGYPGTLGLPQLADYIVGDPVVTPLEHAAHFGETLALMPHCYQPNDRRREIGARPSRSQAGLPPKGFVFCTFNQPSKITPEVFDLWCRLLREVPGSWLWVLDPWPDATANLRREAEARGVASERIVIAPRLPMPAHLGRLQLADLALDTFPYTSHTTGSDALWVGLPLVTRIGETFASRVAASLLNAAGLPELVTSSPDAYFDLAFGLATNPSRLRKLRARLVADRMNCPLFDSERFARDLERVYDRMWADHLAGVREAIVL